MLDGFLEEVNHDGFLEEVNHDGFLEEVNAWWFSKILKGENKGNWETGQGMQGQGSRLGRGKVYK